MNFIKNFILCSFVLALLLNSQTSNAQRSTIPGANYLGKSVNLLKGQSEPGSRSLLQPLRNSEIDALGRGSGKLQTEISISEDITEAENKYSLELGIEGSYGAFAAKADMKLQKEVKERTKTKIVMLTKDLVTDKLSIKSRHYKLESEFKAALNNTRISPKKLFHDYGTHVTLAVSVGGRVTGIYSSKENTNESNKLLEVAAEASYSGVVGSAKVTSKYTQSEINKSKKIRINQKFVVKGAKSKYKAALESSRSPSSYTKWAASVDNNPGFYAFNELMPIWELATSSSRKAELKKGFEIQFTIKSLENLQRFKHQSEKKTKTSTETMRVPKGYKILSGGARTHGGTVGNLLTASYPSSNKTWVAKHVDHHQADYSYVSLYAMAVYDPFDMLDVQIFTKKSRNGKANDVTYSPGFSYDKRWVMTGGGANVDHTSGAPNMLTGSYPKIDSEGGHWTSRSIDLSKTGYGFLTSYTIYALFKTNSYKLNTKTWSLPSQSASQPSLKYGLGDDAYHFVGGGAYTHTPSGGITQNFLIASYPEGKEWVAKSKDHFVSRPAMLTVFSIGLKVISMK